MVVLSHAAPSGPPLRILTLDGGGVRGVVTLRVLRELERLGGAKIHEMFDLIGGTSTGGILAVLLGCLKLPVTVVEEMYAKLGKDVFDKVKSGRRHAEGAT